MEDLYNKFNNLIKENASLKYKIIDLESEVEILKAELKRTEFNNKKVVELEVENNHLKEKIEQSKENTIKNDGDACFKNKTIEENLNEIKNAFINVQKEDKNEALKDQPTKTNNFDFSNSSELKNILDRNDLLESSNKELQETQKRLTTALELNNLLKVKIAELQTDDTKDKLKQTLKNIREWVTGITGYKMEFTENTITLSSLYAFDREDVFIFNISGENLELMSNSFAESWSEEIRMYLVNGRSVPAFLACVTLELFNRSTFS